MAVSRVEVDELSLVQKTFSLAVVEAFIQAAKSTACTRGQY